MKCDTPSFAKTLKCDGPGSVWFGYGLGVEQFERFRFSVPAVPDWRGVVCALRLFYGFFSSRIILFF